MGPFALVPLIEAQRRNLPLWIPVLLGVGIGGYFGLPLEPLPWMLVALTIIVAICLLSLFRLGPLGRIGILVLMLPLVGYALAAVRSHLVAAPVLPYPISVNIEGRIVGLDRSGSNRPRVLLDQVIIHGRSPADTPERVRISLSDETPDGLLQPGLTILGQARLSPPAAPVEPRGFDFRKYAWFQSLGAVGYSNTPFVERAAKSGSSPQTWLFKIRVNLSRRIQEAIPNRNGGFAAAILTGDRSAVDPGALNDLRRSNLAHLLAISGLHMGLLTGFVFALVRYGLALMPRIVLYYSTKKIAAVCALVAGAAYLGLSGGNVATQRAFIMTGVILVAVLLDRPAFTLRSVALAAVILLVLRPESLTEAGFQMSFAATTALIATFEWLRTQEWWRETLKDNWRFVRPVIGVAVTSFVAGTATAPISAFHFNMMSQYGLFANVLAVPSMGLVVMPFAVISGILSFVGLAAPSLWVMDQGISYILAVADFFSNLDGSVRAVPKGPSSSLVLIVVGCIFFVIWLGRLRIVALVPVLLGFFIWSQAERPLILITENGRLFGVMTAEGRVFNSEKGNGFSATAWLRNDGDSADQAEAFERSGIERGRGWAEATVKGVGPIIYRGSKVPGEDASQYCRDSAILVAPNWNTSPGGRCYFIGKRRLRNEGSIAIFATETGFTVTGAKSVDTNRLWSRQIRTRNQ